MGTRTISHLGAEPQVSPAGALVAVALIAALLISACGAGSEDTTVEGEAKGAAVTGGSLSEHEWSIHSVDDGAGIVLRGIGESPTETLVEGQISPGNPAYEWDVDTGLPLPVVRIDAVLTEFADDQQGICDGLNEWRRTLAQPPPDGPDDVAPSGRAHYVARAAFSSHATRLARDSRCTLADVGSFVIATTDDHDEATAPVIWPSPIGRDWACPEGSRSSSAGEPGDEPGPETVELLIRDFGGISDQDPIEQAGDGTWIVVNEDGELTNQFTVSPHPAGGFMMDKWEYC